MYLSATQVDSAVRSAALPPRVLVAVGRRTRARAERILAGWRAQFVESLDEVPEALREGHYDLIVVGAHFDASQGLRALKEVVRAHPACPVAGAIFIPFDPRVGKLSHRLFRAACMALGANAALDLSEIPDDDAGRAQARSRLAALLE